MRVAHTKSSSSEFELDEFSELFVRSKSELDEFSELFVRSKSELFDFSELEFSILLYYIRFILICQAGYKIPLLFFQRNNRP